MPDAQKIAPCDKCGRAAEAELITVNGLTRYRVKCGNCQHMTPHFCAKALAVTLWNSWAAGGKSDLLAG